MPGACKGSIPAGWAPTTCLHLRTHNPAMMSTITAPAHTPPMVLPRKTEQFFVDADGDAEGGVIEDCTLAVDIDGMELVGSAELVYVTCTLVVAADAEIESSDVYVACTFVVPVDEEVEGSDVHVVCTFVVPVDVEVESSVAQHSATKARCAFIGAVIPVCDFRIFGQVFSRAAVCGRERLIPRTEDIIRRFVKLGVSGARLEIYEDGKLKKKRVADVSLPISLSNVRKHKLEFGELGSGEHVKLTLALDGVMLTASDVAKRRREEAENALGTSEERMEKIDLVTNNLRLIMELGNADSQINPIAQTAFAVAKLAFDRVNDIPTTYIDLKNIVLECMQDIKLDEIKLIEIKLDEIARNTYRSKAMRDILGDLMSSIIEALELISHYYAQSPISK
ncbi:hypothetical protein FISHEDRAFT_73632 [Fistulina hepatica ATCC 64428]|uniref:Uncharacterized protein n=1 Tax=Fistulina hepatica ATCC 64428 TaxID=1128425 RepID=A0A0D7AEY4_9AGAR|nr:hypothetical protein FISHEDRAFT_73632 [Fistulina hepatica ATCC 64428]